MTSRQHVALNVHEPVTRGVSTKQSRLVSIINGESVAVAKSEVSVLVEDGSVTVSAALVVHGHPVGAILAVSNNSLIENNISELDRYLSKSQPEEEQQESPTQADNPRILLRRS